ncbi:hypothetical protein AB0H43_16310 [Hamadaea sp. NPDC050747]|uniref:hypothetical protein n=1 Tax=Hamadaea sp. NPDC050747 TaxID=3155789 RepID=UPI0033FBB4DF
MQPDGQQVQAAVEAMRADAAMWRDMASELRGAASTADALDLGRRQFSMIADQLGMTELYQQVQERLVQLIGQGAETFEATASALTTAAAGYEADEAAAVHRLHNIY